MKKYTFAYIIAGIILVTVALGVMIYHTHKVNHYYETIKPHSKLLKETWVWLYDSAIYKREGTYLRIYRKYNYHYGDSITGGYMRGRYTLVRYAVTDAKDTCFLEFTDLTNYPHR